MSEARSEPPNRLLLFLSNDMAIPVTACFTFSDRNGEFSIHVSRLLCESRYADRSHFSKQDSETPLTRSQSELKETKHDQIAEVLAPQSTPGVPKLGYMYPSGYICLSEGVHLKLAIEGKNMFIYYSFPIIYAYISEHNESLNFFSIRDNVGIFLTYFRLQKMQCKWMFTKKSTLSTPQRKCRMLWQQSQKMCFVSSHSQVYYDNFHHRLPADFQNKVHFSQKYCIAITTNKTTNYNLARLVSVS